MEFSELWPGQLYLIERFLVENDSHRIAKDLIDATDWEQRSIVLFGKEIPQPRLMSWVGDAGASYRYSGLDLLPKPWTPTLSDLRGRIEAAATDCLRAVMPGHGASEHGAAIRFNSVLLNLYRNERDSMGMHADDEPELGPQPVIASLSLGAERVLHFASKKGLPSRKLGVKLPSGSLLVMAGNSQAEWKHGLPKRTAQAAARVNLTFRQVMTPRPRPDELDEQ